MAISLVQTDDTVPCAAAVQCSGGSLHGNADEAKAVKDGTAGTTEDSLSLGTTNQTGQVCYMFDCEIPEGASWDSGDWTIPINFSTGDMNATLQEVHVCRVNSICNNQESLGSETGIGHTTNTGDYTSTVSGSSVASPAALDRVSIVLVFDIVSSHSGTTIGITPGQTITCPFTEAGPGGAATRNIMLLGVS